LALLAAKPARALDDSTWRSVPLHGGEIHTLAFSPLDADVVLAGTAAGQVYLSRDAGASWRHAGRPFPLPGWVVASLQFDPNRQGRVWAALRGVWGGGAVVRSDDLGATWDQRALLPRDEIFSLALVPGEEGRLLLGTRVGVLGSSDAGESWRHLSAGQADLVEVSSLLVAPHQPQTVLAGTFRRAFRSDDGGATWRGVFDGMVLDSQVFTLTPVPGSPAEVWASTCGWVYRSGDLGEHWSRFKGGLSERRTPSFQVLPSGRLLAGTVGGVYTSDDGGTSWGRRTRDDLTILAIAYHPRRPQVVLAGTEGSGVWRSNDGGDTFAPAYRGIAAPRVTALTAGPGEVVAAVAHGGPASGIYVSTDGGRRFLHQLSQIPTVLALASNGKEAWAATEQGLWTRREGLWERVEEVPADRFERVVTGSNGRVVARGASVSYERLDGRFAALSAPAGAVAVTAPEGDEDAIQLGRWSAKLRGRGRVIATGDPAFPALVLRDQAIELLSAPEGRLHRIDLPFPPRDVLAAAVHAGSLFLGTSGLGLLYAELGAVAPDAAPMEAAAGAAAAGGGR
jgi:photosystem II stability/assembly factor-like uncharacterized protein